MTHGGASTFLAGGARRRRRLRQLGDQRVISFIADAAAPRERARSGLERSAAAGRACDVARAHAPERRDDRGARAPSAHRAPTRLPAYGCAHPVAELSELLDLFGLTDVLRVEPGRQPEQREEPLGVEERVEMGDPPV